MPDDRDDQDGRSDTAVPRWRTLPPRVRLRDTIAVQETPPKPQVILTPDDPFREATTDASG